MEKETSMIDKMTIQEIRAKKTRGEKIAMLTAYDYPLAALVDASGIDIALVGDSLANVVLGLDSTTDIGMPEMLHHAKAVRRGIKRALLIADMPFDAYQRDPSAALANARRFIEEAGCQGVKLEWFEHCAAVTETLVSAGIPVMGHIGLTPQTAEKDGGFKVRGKDARSAQDLIEHARILQAKGCFSLVLECVPDKIAKIITEELMIPTIGIGAGAFCDGQVLVTHDVLGLFDRYKPKFVKQYVNLSSLISQALRGYCEDVRAGRFPDAAHSFGMPQEEADKLNDLLKNR